VREITAHRTPFASETRQIRAKIEGLEAIRRLRHLGVKVIEKHRIRPSEFESWKSTWNECGIACALFRVPHLVFEAV